ncbi:hypothetical protein MTP99_011326 [Tenebrio molitor]|nr:hypothetical protein MTP99_011326 [Tenebrio molitor]
MPKPLPKRSKEMIASLIEYFTKERDHGEPILSLKSIQQRVADALKINLRTVSSVNNQVKAGEPLTSLKKIGQGKNKYVTLVNLKNVKFERVFMRWKTRDSGIITGSSSKETNFSRVHKFIKQSFT